MYIIEMLYNIISVDSFNKIVIIIIDFIDTFRLHKYKANGIKITVFALNL